MKENKLRQCLTAVGSWAALVIAVVYFIAATMIQDLVYLAVATSMVALSLAVRVYAKIKF